MLIPCAMAVKNREFKKNWRKEHRRYFRIAGITIQVDSDLPMNDKTFHSKFKVFEARGPGKDIIKVRHHFFLPDLKGQDLGEERYRKAPWAIYEKGDSWVYLGIFPLKDKRLHRVAVFSRDHTRAKIYNYNQNGFLRGNLNSLTLFPSDQILLARILAERQGCFLHSCGVNLGGKGLLFVGHSGAGKSTMATMLKNKSEILCDDRIIVRKEPGGFRIHGTWSHGDVTDVSGGSAPLKAIMFLEKARNNEALALKDPKEIVQRLVACLIKPFVTADWWDKSLALIDVISREVPCYRLRFDKSGKVIDLLDKLEK